jgi:capsular exopolysaccharide synthesis family protein
MSAESAIPPNLNSRIRSVLERNTIELAMAHGNLLSANMGKELSSILVTSCHADEGKTSAALSLAYAASRHARQQVLLIDGNASSPALHDLLETDLSPGLIDIVFDRGHFEDIVRPTGLPNVSVLPYGSGSASSLAVFRSPAFARNVKSMQAAFDLVILDGPALLVSSDASLASPHFDGVVLVVACEDTQWGVAQHVQTKIESVGGKMLGVVLNRRRYYVPNSLYGRY